MRKSILALTAAVAAFFVTPAFAQELDENGCSIMEGMQVCIQAEPYVCEELTKYRDQHHFAESHGGVVDLFHQVNPFMFLMRVRIVDNGKLRANLIFEVDRIASTVCLTVVATPIVQPSGMRV